MRLGELLRSTVVDSQGERLGRVRDVRLVQDGPYIEGFGNALRVDGLIVGAASVVARLGYHRQKMNGPALLNALFMALGRRARYVRWEDVVCWDGETVEVSMPASELAPLSAIYGD